MSTSTSTASTLSTAHGPAGHQDATVVLVGGELDLHTVPPLRALLTRLLRHDGAAGAPCVVVDLSGVTFLDSHALGVLVLGHRLARAHRRTFVLVSTSPGVEQLFRVTGMHHVMPLHPDVITALAHHRIPPAV